MGRSDAAVFRRGKSTLKPSALFFYSGREIRFHPSGLCGPLPGEGPEWGRDQGGAAVPGARAGDVSQRTGPVFKWADRDHLLAGPYQRLDRHSRQGAELAFHSLGSGKPNVPPGLCHANGIERNGSIFNQLVSDSPLECGK